MNIQYADNIKYKCVSTLDAKQQYGNSYFCYTDQFAILTNEFGFVRYIAILNDGFKATHPEMPVKKKSDSIDEDKFIGDSSYLKLVCSDFFSLYPGFYPDIFLGDFAFDTIETYGFLKDEFHFSKVLIAYNLRNESTLEKVSHNAYNIINEDTLCCLNGSSLLMKRRNYVKVNFISIIYFILFFDKCFTSQTMFKTTYLVFP